MLPRQKSRSRERRESRMFLVDGQLCWADDSQAGNNSSSASMSKRRSSVGYLFGSSMDLSGIGQSMDSSGGAGSGSEEAISYRIKWCRENIMQLKRQTWPMQKKLQVLRASKLFIKQHQGELKQSKQAKDVIASTSALADRYWRHFKREFANFLVIITPWEMRIKKIESHFGSVVASYFTFLRWIFWLNLANSLVMCSFVMVPELIENVPDFTGMRKGELGMQQPSGDDGEPQKPPDFNPTLGEMWEFEGFLKFSPIFYGYYSNAEISRSGFWRNPLAFLMSAMLTYLFCFFCISRKLSQNAKLSRIGSKDDEYTFCWTVFVGWDFMIGNSETAYNKTSSLVMNLKEGILEEKEQTKDVDWRLIIRRVFANVLTMMLIVASAYVVTLAVQRSENLPEDASLLQKNELQLVMSGIQFMFPPLFDVIGIIEKYHPRKALSWQLGRILFLDFLNFYTLMFSLFDTVDKMGVQLNEVAGNITLLRKNATYYNNLFATTTTTSTTTLPSTTVNASVEPPMQLNATTVLTTLLLASSVNNMSTTTTELAIVSSTLAPNATTQLFVNITTTTTTSTSTTELLTTLAEASTTTTTTLASTSSSQPPPAEDSDYPDVGEALKSENGRRRRRSVAQQSRKSKKRAQDEEFELISEDLPADVRAAYLAASVHVPPVNDPYGKLGTSTRIVTTNYRDDDDEEEPMEGRLVAPRVSTTTTARTRYKSPVARPIGGARRQKQQQAPTTVSLNDDSDEQEESGSSLPPGAPLNAQDARNALGSVAIESEAGPTKPSLASFDYAIITPEFTTINSETTSSGQTEAPKDLSATTITISDVQFAGSSQQPPQARTLCPITAADATLNPITLSPVNASIGGVSMQTQSHVGFNASELNYEDCVMIPEFQHQEILGLNETFKDKLKSLCWETMFGQEMVKIVVMDLVMTVVSAVSFEFMRACFVRYCNRFFFWDLERGFPGYQDFKIAENVLHLVNNQSTVWMGMFFAPGLPAINTVKLAVLMYVRSWAVLTCNIPHETVFKVSKSNNFYYWILLINLLICILPVAYAVTWIRPSWHCGPFGGECRMYIVVTKLVKSMLPPDVNNVFKYLNSPGAVIPALIALILIIYYLASTLSSSKEANKELKAQLKKDKEQEAAVPEITNTTVVDATPAGIAPAPVAPAANQQAIAAAASTAAAPTNPMSFAQAANLSAASSAATNSSLLPPAPQAASSLLLSPVALDAAEKPRTSASLLAPPTMDLS